MKKQMYKDKCLFAYTVRVGRAINDLWTGNGVQEKPHRRHNFIWNEKLPEFSRWKN